MHLCDFDWLIQYHPTHGRVKYRWSAQCHCGEVKLHVDEGLLLESRRLKGRAPYQVDRVAAQILIGILQRLRIQHAAVLCVKNRMNDHWLKEG